jgi:hypothetical protein
MNINMGDEFQNFDIIDLIYKCKENTFITERKTGSCKPTANISNGHSIRTKEEKRPVYIYIFPTHSFF